MSRVRAAASERETSTAQFDGGSVKVAACLTVSMRTHACKVMEAQLDETDNLLIETDIAFEVRSAMTSSTERCLGKFSIARGQRRLAFHDT